MNTQSEESQRIGVGEHEAAKAIGVSVYFLRKDRRTKRQIPFYRIGDRCLYSLDRIKVALAAMEEGGPQSGRRAGGKR